MTGNLISKSVTSRNKTDSTQYLWDVNMGLPQVLTESKGKDTALFTYGLGRISMADPRKGKMYYQYDGLGSVRGLSDRKGMTKGLYAYDAFGKPLISASLVDNDFQYTGEQVDDETGLIYLRSRYYDPEIGRFISRDSFAGFDTNIQSLNRYTYVQNNPVVYADPSGKISVLAAAGLAGLYGACASTGWYIGDQLAIQYKTGNNQFSLSTLGGRAAGGFAAGSSAGLILGAAVTVPELFIASPYAPMAAGATAAGASYAADRWTQGQLQNLGLGKAESWSDDQLRYSMGAGVLAGPIAVGGGSQITPYIANKISGSVSSTITQNELSGLMGSGVVNTIYKNLMSYSNYGNTIAQSSQSGHC